MDVPRPADSKTDSDNEQGTPLWVKVFGGIGVVFVLAFVILHLAGGGFRHLHSRSGEPRGQASPSGLSEPGVQRP